MSYRRITLKADYPSPAEAYTQKIPPSRVPSEVPAWIRQQQAAGFLEMIRLERVRAFQEYRLGVQKESLRARKEYYGEKYGTMVVPGFETYVKGWEQQQYRSFSAVFQKWKLGEVAGFNVAVQAAIFPPKIERQVTPAVPKGALGGYTVDRDMAAVSKSFYTEIGYPQYAGHEPFQTPEGYKVSGIEKTGKGLQITFESTAPKRAKGIAETIMSWKLPTISIPSIIPEDVGKGIVAFLSLGHVEPYPWQKKATGLKAPAAAVAVVEAPVYTVGRLLGYETPRSPPTFIGGVIGKGIEKGFGIPSTELEETMVYGPEYAAATVGADVLLSIITGRAVGAAWKRIRGVKGVKITGAEEIERFTAKQGVLKGERLTSIKITTVRVPAKYGKWLKEMDRYFVGEEAWLAGKEKIFIKGGKELLFLQKPVEVTRGAGAYVSAVKTWKIPSLLTRVKAKFGLTTIKPPQIYETFMLKASKETVLPSATRLSLRQFTGVQIFGKIDTQVYLRLMKNVPAPVAQKWLPQMGGLTLKQLTKHTPQFVKVAPKFVSVTTPSLMLPKLTGAGLTLGLKAFPKPSIKVKAVTLTLPQIAKPQELEDVFQKEAQQQKTPQIFKTFDTQKQRQDTSQIIKTFSTPKQIPILKIPVPTLPTTLMPKLPFLPRRERLTVSKRGKGLFGKWFKREHPIPTVEYMARTFGLSIPKKKSVPKKRSPKKKRKRRKTKKKTKSRRKRK